MPDEHVGRAKNIHFISDVTCNDVLCRCHRCGEATPTKMGMYEHRRGILSECLMARIRTWVIGL